MIPIDAIDYVLIPGILGGRTHVLVHFGREAADLTPQEARHLARALLRAADAAEAKRDTFTGRVSRLRGDGR